MDTIERHKRDVATITLRLTKAEAEAKAMRELLARYYGPPNVLIPVEIETDFFGRVTKVVPIHDDDGA